MNRKIARTFVEVTLISLLFAGCISSGSETTTPAPTTPGTTASPASFEVTELRVIPDTPTVGDTVTILVDVRNTGDVSGSYTVLVTVGSASQTQNIELDGKSSKTVEFEASMDTEGSVEITAGTMEKTIVVVPEPVDTLPPTTAAPTPQPTTAAPTPQPTAVPDEQEKIERPEYALGTRLNYLFTVGGDEWGSTISYNSPYEENRTPWFRWGVTDHWDASPGDTYWRGDYIYIYDRNWDLEGVWTDKIGGTKMSFEAYIIIYSKWPPFTSSDCPICKSSYTKVLPNVYPLVQGAEKIDDGTFCLYIPGMGLGGISMPEGRGNYERRINVEEFEDIEAGGETYRCAKVKYYMRHTVEFLSPHYNEDWGKIEWIEEGYHWYSEFGLVKADVTIKTYWWDELEETDTVLIELTGVTLP